MQQTQYQWRIVFYIAAVIYTVGAVFFLIFSEGEVQDWVKPYMSEEESLEKDVVAPPQLDVDQSLQPNLDKNELPKYKEVAEDGAVNHNQNLPPGYEQTKL